MTAKSSFDAGRLGEALTAALDDVKRHPGDVGPRATLSALLCFAGNLEKADVQLNAIGKDDPKTSVGVSLLRHLVRAETARRQFFGEGRLPEFLVDPSPCLKLHLEAAIALREGKPSEAAATLARAEDARPHCSGICDGKPFDDLRDLDDLTASFLEVLTSNGKYYWVPFEQLDTLEFDAPQTIHDLLWRSARMTVKHGPDGVIYVPVTYRNSHTDASDAIRLGRETDWRGGDGAPVEGFGQRVLLLGEEVQPMMQIRSIQVTS